MTKYFICAIIFAAAALSSCSEVTDTPPPPAPAQETTTLALRGIDPNAELVDFNDSFVNAWNASDVTALTALFDADADIIDAYGAKSTGRDAIRARYEAMLNGAFKETTLIVEPHPANWLSDDVAVVSGTYAITRNEETLAAAHFTNLVRREGSGFLLEAIRMTLPVEAPGSPS